MKKFIENILAFFRRKEAKTKKTIQYVVKEEVKVKKPVKTEPDRIEKCFVMDKFMFTREQATKKCEEIKKGKSQYLRKYCCEFCGHWHLTHHKRYKTY
jgi:hypothetical protein